MKKKESKTRTRIVLLLLCLVALRAFATNPSPDSIENAFLSIAKASWGEAQPSFDMIDDAIRDGDTAAHSALEARFCKLLEGDATLVAKQFACRRLASIGSVQSVETLSALLDDQHLSHMARFALEEIPCPEAGTALLEALDKLHGDPRLGVIQSLGNRSEMRAENALLGLVRSGSLDEARAALNALVQIGGDAAIAVVQEIAISGNRFLEGSALSALVEMAHRELVQGSADVAAKLFTDLYRNESQDQYVLAGFTGLLACPTTDARALIEEAFRSEKQLLHAAAAAHLQETHAKDLIASFAEKLETYPTSAQLAVIDCAANLKVTPIRPALLRTIEGNEPSVRLAAIQALGVLGTAEDVALLARRAAADETADSRAALTSLKALEAEGVNAAMLAMAQDAQPPVARVLVSALTFREYEEALPLAWDYLASPHEALRAAAFEMYEELANSGSLPALLERLDAETDQDNRRRIEGVLRSVCQRQPKETAQPIEQAFRDARETEQRIALLQLLVQTENPSVLSILRQASQDPDADFRSAAIRLLANWDAPEVLPDLRQIAASAEDPRHRAVALSGYLNVVRRSDSPPEEKLLLVKDTLPLIERDEEFLLLAAVLQDIATPDALFVAQSLLENPSVCREAGAAILSMAEKLQYSEAEAVRGALTAIQNGDVPAAMKEQAEALREKLVDYAGRLLKDWDFDAGNAGWIAENDTGITSQNGVLRVDLLGDDPFISTAVSVPGGVFDVQMRIRAPEESETWQIFYGSDEKPLGQPPFWSVNFEAPADAQWHEVSTQLAVDGNLTEFRIDPGLGPNHVEFDWIRLLRSQSDAAKTPTPAAKPETGAKSFSSDAAARILLIGTPPDHPHGTHMYIHECGLLAKCLEQSPGVDAVVSLGWPADEVLVDAANAIVLYSSPGAEIVLRGNHADRFRALMQKGVGLTAIHWSTGIADANDKELEQEYLHYLGGIFSFGFSGLDMVHTDVDQVVPDHPICRGWSNYEQFDEIYLDIQVLDDATPLEKVYVKDKEQVVAWTYERPNANGGRSYGNTLGHFHENFWITSFRRSLVNGILWTAHYEVPKDGAPCAVLPEDMVLIEPEPAKE